MDAAIELHCSVGPARTTVSDIARRAGVQRLTVYRYFPDELSLLGACSGTYRMRNPPPDIEAWMEIADPVERLEAALPELLRYYRRTAPMLSRALRDLSVAPLLREIAGPRLQWAARVHQLLEAGWNVRGKRRRLLRAAIALATDFHAWESLAANDLDDLDIAAVLTGMVIAMAGSKSYKLAKTGRKFHL